MPDCELCGRQDARGYAFVEGVRLAVCAACAKHGKPAGRVMTPQPTARPHLPGAREPALNPDYAELVRRARQRQGLLLEELAKKTAETESFIRKIEAGKLKPTEKLAHKLEKVLNIKLFE